LDVNVLLALSWRPHVHHGEAINWFRKNRAAGFATCPLTQLGFVRLSSNPKFTKDAVSPREAMELLDRITKSAHHTFWPDSLPCRKAMEGKMISGYRQLTDFYLRGLAMANNGILATFDGSIPNTGVFQKHVVLIGAETPGTI
jgi:toxin-antitoxin system PIN domain toxin